MRLIFVRHGEPDYQRDCLTENGVLQAKSTAERLRDEDIRAVYSSPMGRAMETAGYTARMHGLEIRTLDFMHEIDWGNDEDMAGESAAALPYDGHPWTLGYKLLAENPEYIGSERWDRHPYFRDNRCLKHWQRISEEMDGFLSGYGLVREEGLYRCEQERGETIALFAHGGSGAIMFSHVLNLPFPFVLTTLPYGVCSISVINFDEQLNGRVIPRLELFNDMGHIEQCRQEKLHFEK